ncbi:glycosyltransferase family 39 protein [Pseudoxanthomonas sp.]|uniref:glycosyltransferase family 39 protein n=1 Tax=Pseudoxanthomonas sp. TaxID=1871049 RepID=UPI002611C171|nr:glycosyltransferase family 39 protein [Pseudoxanthomonas sp.]WDS36792.1 MAG: glycosyltransferase family 39 protein [Pseudoxanthomonas sp.]
MPPHARPRSALPILILLALLRLALHICLNGHYGFHRDELQVLDDARHLDWGYVPYPPLVPFLAHLELAVFGSSLSGFRVAAAIAQCAVMVLSGLIARELGGRRLAQVAAAVATACMPFSLLMSSMLMYSGLDLLWGVAAAWLILRLANGADLRYWLLLGVVFGLGLMTRYTIVLWAIGLGVGVLAGPLRPQLGTRWPWLGVGVAFVLFLPNLAWQVRHDFIYLDFVAHIHARDINQGRTTMFLPEQLYASASVFTLPIWLAGLAFVAFARSMRPYRVLAWLYLVPLALFTLTRGRGYYMAPGYPMLLAAGCVAIEQWLSHVSLLRARLLRATVALLLVLGLLLGALGTLPVAPVNSSVWRFSRGLHDTFAEQIGWRELAERVARIYRALPADERARTVILANNYGEVGAMSLYGPALGLPPVISRTNSAWYRGPGEPPPRVIIELGNTAEDERGSVARCISQGLFRNREGVDNEESARGYEIFVCRDIPPISPQIWGTKPRFG